MKVVNRLIKELHEDESLKGLFASTFVDADVRYMDLAQVNFELQTV